MDKRERNRIWTRRRLQREGYESIYRRMTNILVQHNPLSFEKQGTAQDEYGGPVGALIPHLDAMSDARQLQFHLHQKFLKFFGPEQTGDEAQYHDIANELWEVWAGFRQQRS